jgi:hypothetical protein
MRCARKGILRIANKFDLVGDKGESSVRFVVRGCLKFHVWIAFAARPDVKVAQMTLIPPRSSPSISRTGNIRTPSDRIGEIFSWSRQQEGDQNRCEAGLDGFDL